MAFSFRKFFAKKSPTNQILTARRGFYSKGSYQVTEDSSMQVSAFHRGLIYVSTQIAKLPWEIKDKNNVVQDGPLANLLSLAPNPETNAFLFRLCMIQNAIIHGNSYAEIERNTVGTPIALWPIRSQDVDVVRDQYGSLKYKVTPTYSNDSSVILDPKDVFHVRNFHSKDGIIGQGIVAYGSETLGISLSADQMASGIFRNGGIPSGVLKHKGTLSDEAYQRLKDSWREQHGGNKAGSTSILEEGVEYEPINIPPEALQFLESRKFSVLEVARFLGIPPTKLFDITAATYSNVENANLEVATDTLDAWAVNLEMEADVKILNGRFGGRYTELDLYSVFRGDMNTRAGYFKSMMQCGAMTPNQIRNREGLAPAKDGDKYYIATNNFTPVDRLDEVIDAQIAPKTQAPAKPEPKPDPEEDPNGDQAPNNLLDMELKHAALQYLKK